MPPGVHALQTTRHGGVSKGAWQSLNLGDHVADLKADVAANRAHISARLPSPPRWMNQVHGVSVFDADSELAGVPEADAAVARQLDRVCVVMTADCLPVLFCDRSGSVVAAAHAGWRGLRSGVLEATIAAMDIDPVNLMAWLGPAIGPAAFEVGAEVRDAFMREDEAAADAFVSGNGDRFFADLNLLARQRLQRMGVSNIYGGGECTFTDRDRYFSYRRDGVTGRMATLIWRDENSGR